MESDDDGGIVEYDDGATFFENTVNNQIALLMQERLDLLERMVKLARLISALAKAFDDKDYYAISSIRNESDTLEASWAAYLKEADRQALQEMSQIREALTDGD